MIHLTHLDDTSFVLEANRIETIEAHPDTVITLIDGKHLVVRQSVEEVVRRVIRYQQLIHCRSFELPSLSDPGDIVNG